MKIQRHAFPSVHWLTTGLVAAGLFAPGMQPCQADEVCTTAELTQLRQQRRQAAQRKRRIIFNNDGNSIVVSLAGKEVSAQALLDDRTIPLLGTHVDSIFYCSWSTGLGLFTHMSEFVEPFYAKTGVYGANRTQEFHERGLDPLKIMVDFCRANDIEIFWSMRMNDIHDADPRWPEVMPQFKKDHPELLFGTQQKPPAFGKWSGLDYGLPEVRQRAFRLLEDVCRRYNVDGIEMDFARHFPHFSCNANGEDCAQHERDLMTGLLQRVRKMTEQVGLERNCPILVAVRIPASLSCCNAIGLDVSHWLEQQLVDILVPGEWEFSPWEPWVALGRRHNVRVYPCLSWTASKKRKGLLEVQDRLPLRSLRSRALNVWNSGADGVYLFNFFFAHSSVWRELGDPGILGGLDRDYFPHGYWRALLNPDIRGVERFIELPVPPFPERPVRLAPETPFVVEVLIGGTLSGGGPGSDYRPEITLSLGISGLTNADTLEVTLNEHDAQNGSVTPDWVSYAVAPEWIRSGANMVRVTSRGESGQATVLRDVHIHIDYPEAGSESRR